MRTWKIFFRHKPSFLFYLTKDQHLNRIQQIEELLNVTRENMKEESKKYFTALWLTGNSTKMDLQSIRMVLNVTRGNIVRQLKEVQDNLTEQVHYLYYLHLGLSEPHFNHSMWGLLHIILLWDCWFRKHHKLRLLDTYKRWKATLSPSTHMPRKRPEVLL